VQVGQIYERTHDVVVVELDRVHYGVHAFPVHDRWVGALQDQLLDG